MKTSDVVTIEGHSSRETDAAIFLELDDGTDAWIPFSQVENMTRDATGGGISITMTKWIAQKKGLV